MAALISEYRHLFPDDKRLIRDMTEKMTSENAWFLKEMMTKSDKDFAEDKTYTHSQVKDMLKARRHENKMVTACIQ